MKLLLRIATALCIVWITRAAPQPLSLINATDSDLSNLTTTVVSDITSPREIQTSTQRPTENESVTSKSSASEDLGSSVPNFSTESYSEAVKAREELDTSVVTESGVRDVTTSTVSSSTINAVPSESLNSTILKDRLGEIYPTTELTTTTRDDENVSKSNTPVSRYVPPLDPMMHMLMMADANGEKNLASKETADILPTTTQISTTEEIDVGIKSESTTSSIEINEEGDESSKAEENRESLATETTASDVISSTLLMKSEVTEDQNLAKDTDLVTETSADSSTFLSIHKSTTDNANEEYSTAKDVEAEKALELQKNSDLVLRTVDGSAEEEKDVAENDNLDSREVTEIVTTPAEETTSEVFSSTEQIKRIEDSADLETLLREDTEIETHSSSDVEITTVKSEPIENSDVEVTRNSETTSVDDIKTTLILTNSTASPEITYESSSLESTTLESAKNIFLEDELEFRSVKLPINISSVEYVSKKVVEPDVVEHVTDFESDVESTTSNILTTIAEMFFSSSSEDPLSDSEEKEEPKSALSTDLGESSESSLPVEKEDLNSASDLGVTLDSSSADMLKTQTVTSGIDSISPEGKSTEAPLAEKTDFEQTSPELSTEEPEKYFKDSLDVDEKTDKFIETSLNPETILVSTSTTGSSTTTVSKLTTDSYISSTEPHPESLDLKNAQSETDVKSDAKEETKPSDYLLNIKDRYVSGENSDMVAAVQFLHYHDKASSEQCFKLVDAHWNYATNLTEENKKKQLEQTLEYSLFHKAAWKNATSFAWKSFNDTLLRRWFKSLSVLGTSALPEDKLNEFNRLKAEMKNTYSTAKICTYVPLERARRGQIIREKDCNLTLEPDLTRILTKSRDYDELVHVWKSWRDAAGKPIREKYLRFVELSNEAAKMNGFSDTGDMWREAYESETFETDLEELWNQLRPLYEHLHAYVRRRLIRQYGSDKIKEDGPIPAHLFGNMWAQSWVSLLDITQPFPGKPSVDVTPIMEAKNMTAYQMFKISEEFFTSLGLKPMPEPFWRYSLIEKPKDREIICHASAWDFCNGRDYRSQTDARHPISVPLMAVRHLYETAFDSTASPADADADPADILETSRRLFSPEPVVQRPSPASSRSSSDSDRSRRARSPGLPLKKIFSPWTCGRGPKGSDTPSESFPSQPEIKEEKDKTFSPSVEFKKLDVADENKKNSADSTLSASFSAKPRASTDLSHNENGSKEVPPSTATSQGEKTVPNLVPDDSALKKDREFENGDCSSTTIPFMLPVRSAREDMKRSNFNNAAVSRNNLWLDFNRAPKRPRRHLCLDINGLNEEDLEPTAQLMKQGWYHGSISRADAENLLRLMKKGSFLVRCSEKLKRQYLLSLKSSRGVMHVKIVQMPNGKYVIKQQTQTFDSIPQLIQYFSTHILNIHDMNVYLSHPVIEKLL